jgi:tellurite resistance protein TerC
LDVDLWMWLAFVAFVAVMLALDLFVFHRDAHEVSFREASAYSALWVGLGLAFGVVVLVFGGPTAGGEYFAGYLIEKALSVDNVFVFALVFAYFSVPAKYQHRVLFWGVVGALAMRAVFIAAGAELLETYDFVVYLFGALLIATGIRMALHRVEAVRPERNPVLRLLRRHLAITDRYHGQRFWVRRSRLAPGERPSHGRALFGVWVATPLLAVLVMVETTDLIFAVDSIPAIFAITTDTFIVFTSNAFALLGLRALYFMLAGAMRRFVYLKTGLAVILVFVGAKFIYGDLVGKVPIAVSLPFIAVVVSVSIGASLWVTRRDGAEAARDRIGADERREHDAGGPAVGGPSSAEGSRVRTIGGSRGGADDALHRRPTERKMTTSAGTRPDGASTKATAAPISVLIADDHELFRRGLAGAVRRQPRFELVAEAADGRDALTLIAALEPDVAVLDFRMPELSGVDVCAQLRLHPHVARTAVLLLSAYEDPEPIGAAVAAGAAGYIGKSASQREILAAIESVGRGGIVYSAGPEGSLSEAFGGRSRRRGHLTDP